VTATISGGSGGTIGTLIVGTTTATASSGVATFTGLGIDGTNGTTYTITYTVSDLTVATATVTLVPFCDGSSLCAIGDTGPGGGTIFYVATGTFTSTGSACNTNGAGGISTCKYLEAAPNTWSGGSADPTITWATNSNQTTGVTGADGTLIGTGYQNSLDIFAQTGNEAASSAAVAARGYTGGSKNDWFLPSKNELAELNTRRNNVGGFVLEENDNTKYWSSTELTADAAWYQSFKTGTGSGGGGVKTNAFYVRPIRAFGAP
jgi:hypothetical protein